MTTECPAVVPIGDSCYCLQLGDDLNPDIYSRVLSIYRRLNRPAGWPCGVLDIVPAYSSLAVHFDPVRSDAAEIHAWIWSLAQDAAGSVSAPVEGSLYTVRVRYDGPDLDRVAAHTGFSVEEVVRRHSQGYYTVAMIGFMPHFPYLLGLDISLACPRLHCPRPQVPRGAVAIGGGQTGIYPECSPGGWNLIGFADPSVCMKLAPGDRLRFVEEGSA